MIIIFFFLGLKLRQQRSLAFETVAEGTDRLELLAHVGDWFGRVSNGHP